MPPLTIKAPAYAAMLGIKPRSLLKIITVEKMPGCSKRNRIWRVDPAKAEPWLRQNHPRLFEHEVIAIAPGSSSASRADEEPVSELSEEEAADRHIRRLNRCLEGMVTVLHDGTCDRALVQSIKQVSAELRLLERHRLDMRTRNAELMTRHEHHQLVATLARVIATEIDGLGHTFPEEVLSALTGGGCTISKPKTALKLATITADAQVQDLRERIADAIDRSTPGDP